MIKKKICMVGAFAVGKTSLVQRFVKSIFDDKYLTTVGVKIDKKAVEVNGTAVELLLWDIQGEDELSKMRLSYLKGAAGYLFVVDGTRSATLDTALEIEKLAEASKLGAPSIILINKSDLEYQWEISEEEVQSLTADGRTVIKTSAKNGTGVEEAFLSLTQRMLGP